MGERENFFHPSPGGCMFRAAFQPFLLPLEICSLAALGCVQPTLLSVQGRVGDSRSAWLCGLKASESWVCVNSGEDGVWVKQPAWTVLHSLSSSNSTLPALCWFCTPQGRKGRDGRDWCAFICAELKVLLRWCPLPSGWFSSSYPSL